MVIIKAVGIAQAISECLSARPQNMLVVGCGSGDEAVSLKRYFDCKVTGIDIKTNFSSAAHGEVSLQYGDATAMEFQNEAFDFVYSYHALEHIPNYRSALAEIRRVLQPDGGWCIGTPNRSRLIGYLGSADASLSDKFLWNLEDWKMRVLGKFRNEYGAHAGYTARELRAELTSVFGDAVDITVPYYRHIYPGHVRTIDRLDSFGMGQFLFPSVYFAGRRSR
jgi:ubiquinone/menaquinone biosynthesis C-methylase UbiE